MWLLGEIRRHEAAVEADLQEVYHLDYRDRYRPGGGASQLTTRRLLVLVDGLHPTSSRFWSAVAGRSPDTPETILLGGVYQATAGQWHPWTTRDKDAAEARRFEEQKKRIRAAERARQRILAARAKE